MGVEYIIDEKLFAGLPAKENRRLGVNAARTKAQRADIQIPAADPQADGWQHGNVVQINDPTGAHLHRPAKSTPEKANSDQAESTSSSFSPHTSCSCVPF